MSVDPLTFGQFVDTTDSEQRWQIYNAVVAGGSGGNPFNQSLNTTDDVTFNSVTGTTGIASASGGFSSLSVGSFVASGTVSWPLYQAVVGASDPDGGSGGGPGSITLDGGNGLFDGSHAHAGGYSGSINLSGGSAGLDVIGNGVDGGQGGFITMIGATGGDAGSITTSGSFAGNGGSINTSAQSNYVGGSINTSAGAGGVGGSINTTGSIGANGGYIYTAASATNDGGYINTSSDIGTSGGYINTSAQGGNGGYINTSGDITNPANGGSINTSGRTSSGGGINTSDGGGSIDTNVGYIQLGLDGTRTTFNATSTANRIINLPDAAGTIVLKDTNNVVQIGATYFTTPVLVSQLPSATGNAGLRAFVSDALSTTFNGSVTGGGGNKIPVFSNGSAWKVG